MAELLTVVAFDGDILLRPVPLPLELLHILKRALLAVLRLRRGLWLLGLPLFDLRLLLRALLLGCGVGLLHEILVASDELLLTREASNN